MPLTCPVGDGFYHGPNGQKHYSDGLKRWQREQESATGILAESVITAGGVSNNRSVKRVVYVDPQPVVDRLKSKLAELHHYGQYQTLANRKDLEILIELMDNGTIVRGL